jgi:hypothetical protein
MLIFNRKKNCFNKREQFFNIICTFFHFYTRDVTYLDHPNSGGPAQAKAMIQVKATPAPAWVLVNLKLPMGLQTTMYLSTARTTRDHRATSPGEEKRGEWIRIHLTPYLVGSIVICMLKLYSKVNNQRSKKAGLESNDDECQIKAGSGSGLYLLA